MLSEVSSLGVGLKFMFPSTVWPLHVPQHCMTPNNTIQLQPCSWHSARPQGISPCVCTAQHEATEPGKTVLQTALKPCCASPSSPAPYPHKVTWFSSPDLLLSLPQLSDTVTLLGLHFFVLQQESVPRQKARAYMGITLLVSLLLKTTVLCLPVVQCLKTINVFCLAFQV